MEHAWLSVLPFLVVIPIAIWLKEIMPALVIGLLVGSFCLEPTLTGGLKKSVDYIIQTLANADNIKIVAFLYLFGGLIGLMQISGGIKGFSQWVSSKVRSERGLIWLIWLTIPFTFMTPMFRIMMIGPVLKSISERIEISKRRIGYALDVSTEPIIVLMPVATAFVGFMVSVVGGAMQQNSIPGSAYQIFLYSILFNFFAIILLIIGLFTTFRSSSAVRKELSGVSGEDEQNELHRVGIEKELSLVRAQPWNLIIPLLLLLLLTLYLLWEDGRAKGGKTWLESFAAADATFVMMLAIFITLLFTYIYYFVRREKLPEMMFHFFDGGNQLMTAILLLILVWSTSLAAEDLGFSQFVSSTLGSFVPKFAVPAIVFILGSLVAYFIGTSWGTWGLFMPLGIALAAATGASIPITAGAVFASGTFGAFASPIGDTTITTASIMEMSIIDYAKYKLKIAFIAAALTVIAYLLASFLL